MHADKIKPFKCLVKNSIPTDRCIKMTHLGTRGISPKSNTVSKYNYHNVLYLTTISDYASIHHVGDDVMADAPRYQETCYIDDVTAAPADQYHHLPKEEVIAQHTCTS